MKKWIFRLLGFIVFLLIGLLAYVEFNKEKIIQKVVLEINKNITAELSYEDADVSLLRSLPNLRISLFDIVVKEEQAPKLLELKEFGIKVNLLQALRNTTPITIEEIILKDGQLSLVSWHNDDNYTITQETKGDQSEIDINLIFNKISLDNLSLSWEDQKSNSFYNLDNLVGTSTLFYSNGDLSLKNNLTADINTYLSDLPIDIKTEHILNINGDFDHVAINNASLYANDLLLNFNVSIDIGEEAINYQSDFSAPEAPIKSLFSIIPDLYKHNYQSLETDGQFDIKGSIDGSTLNEYPDYEVEVEIKDGMLSYSGLTKEIEQIGINIKAHNSNPNNAFDQILLSHIDIKSGSNFIGGDINLTSNSIGISSSSRLNTYIDLSDIREVLSLQEQEMSGILQGEVSLNTSFLAEKNKIVLNDENFKIDFLASDIYSKKGLIEIRMDQLDIKNKDQSVEYNIEDLNYPGIKALFTSGTLEDIVSILNSTQNIKGTNNTSIAQIDLDLLSGDTDTSMTVYQIPKFNIKTDVTIDQINYDNYDISQIQSIGYLSDSNTLIEYEIQSINNNKLKGTAELKNLIQYGLNNDTLRGRVSVLSDKIELDRFVQGSESEGEQASSNIPGNIKIDVDYNIEKISYQGINLSKLLGDMSLDNQVIKLENKANLFGGKIGLIGSFNSQIPTSPKVDFDIIIENISFEETAKQLLFFEKLLPFASFLEGEYSGALKWGSALDAQYFPILNTLSSYGEIATYNGAITSFAPIDSLLNFIGSSKVLSKSWSIDDTEKYFLVEDGKVIVQEITLHKNDIDIRYSGSHSFDQEIDYDVILSIPKSKLDAQNLLNLIQDKSGITKKIASIPGDVKLELFLTLQGKMFKPKVKIKDIAIRKGDVVESIKESAVQEVTDKTQEVISTVEDTLDYYEDKIKDSLNILKNEVNETKDSIEQILKTQIDSSKKELSKESQMILDSLKAGKTDSLKKNIEDIFKDQKDKIDALKGKIKLNPFKKKKEN